MASNVTQSIEVVLVNPVPTFPTQNILLSDILVSEKFGLDWLVFEFSLFATLTKTMPNSNSSPNFNFFRQKVWLALSLSAVCVILVLQQLTSYFERKQKFETESEKETNEKAESTKTRPIKTSSRRLRNKTKIRKITLYVFGNLLSQGQNFISHF